MSYNSLTVQSRDPAFNDRVIAATVQEAFENPATVDSEFGRLVRNNPAEGVRMVWPVAIATEAEYASALAGGVPNPGGDEAVVTDNMILSAVQASWPADPA